METKNELLGKTKDAVEVLGRIVLGVLAICYVVGLITVNQYYSRFGVYSLNLFRLNYVIAGFWVITPIVFTTIICVVLVIFGFALQWHFRKKRGVTISTKGEELFVTMQEALALGSQAVPFLFFIFLMFITIIIVLGAVSLNIRVTAIWLGLFLECLFTILAAVGAAYFAYRFKSTVRTALVTGFMIVFLLMFTLHTFVFARDVYGTIPAHLGGGAPKEVQMLLKVDEADKMYFRMSGLHFYKDLNQTESAHLLFETDNEFVLLVKSNIPGFVNTLSVKRDLVDSVLYTGFRAPPVFGTSESDTTWDDPTPSPTPAITLPHTSPTVPSTSPSP